MGGKISLKTILPNRWIRSLVWLISYPEIVGNLGRQNSFISYIPQWSPVRAIYRTFHYETFVARRIKNRRCIILHLRFCMSKLLADDLVFVAVAVVRTGFEAALPDL